MIEVNVERQDGVLSAMVTGRIDGSNVMQFEESVKGAIEDGDRAVVLDMENLTYISSAGLRAILMTAKLLQNRNAKFMLCSLSKSIREVFEVSGFDKIINIQPDRTQALAAIGSE